MTRSSLKLSTFMNICTNLASLSHDSKYQVATIIITDDFREICSIGYNGDYAGGPNTRVNFSSGQSGFLHSEENALFHLGRPLELRSKLILMCTHKPCTMCAKRIANSGIQRVIYNNEYHDDINGTDDIFYRTNVTCLSFNQLSSDNSLLEAYLNERKCH